MIYTLFYSRMRELDEAGRAGYAEISATLRDIVTTENPGFVDLKTFVAEDGERISVARFRDEASHEAWRRQPEHRRAMALGRDDFYDEYRFVVCHDVRERAWSRTAADRAAAPSEAVEVES